MLLVLYWVAVVVTIVGMDREPTVTLLWLIILVALPGVGLLIYFFAGRDWKRIHPRQRWVKDLRATPRAVHGADLRPIPRATRTRSPRSTAARRSSA